MASTFYLPAIKNILNSWKTKEKLLFYKKGWEEKVCLDLMIFLILTMTDTWMQSREMLEDAGLDPDEFDF